MPGRFSQDAVHVAGAGGQLPGPGADHRLVPLDQQAERNRVPVAAGRGTDEDRTTESASTR